jgi:hypothetical protein
MTDLEQIDEFLENYKKVSPKKYYSEAQINKMFVKDFMDYRRSIMMNEKLSARQKAMILAGMIGAGGLTGGLTSCAQPNTEDNTNIEQEETVTMVNVTFENESATEICIYDEDSSKQLLDLAQSSKKGQLSFEKDKVYNIKFCTKDGTLNSELKEATFSDDSSYTITIESGEITSKLAITKK